MRTPSHFRSSTVRVKRPQRDQVEFQTAALDELLTAEHPARSVWCYVESLDLSLLYGKIRATAGVPGRDAVDPRILMSLWMFATIEGVSSARQVARLCERDIAYRWICGGVGVNYHLLSDFRTAHADFLDQLLTDTIATLLHQNLVTLETTAQDGMRVRAHAGSSSFRRKPTLEKCREEAQQQVEQLQAEREAEGDTGASQSRREAARRRAAEERRRRIDQALEDLETLSQKKEKTKKGSGAQARVSMTDPEARNMKMGDGGYRPAYNVQFETDGDTRLIVGADVTNEGSDAQQMGPMTDQVERRYQRRPKQKLVDGGFINHNSVTELERKNVEVIGPIRGEALMQSKGHDPHARQEKDTDESFAFRQRMATEEAKTLYKKRPSIAEFPNAECRNRGLLQFPVRGLAKVRAVTLWHAITFNFMRLTKLGWLSRVAKT